MSIFGETRKNCLTCRSLPRRRCCRGRSPLPSAATRLATLLALSLATATSGQVLADETLRPPHVQVLLQLPAASGTNADVRSPPQDPTRAETPGTRPPLDPEAGFVLDGDTRSEGDLRYLHVYTPSIAPMKRVHVWTQLMDEGNSYRLITPPTPYVPQPVDAMPPAGWVRFSGSMRADLLAERWTTLPSVAPDMVFVRFQTDPEVPLVVGRDAADRYAVRVTRSGSYALTWEVAVPGAYFGERPAPGGLRHPRPEAPQIAPTLGRRVRRWLPPALLPSGDEAGVVALQEWFLAFVAGPVPANLRTGHLLEDVLRTRRGVCRHRAAAFVAVLHAHGVPARMVMNEAHAFAEVWLDDIGWRRMDLGGDAASLTVEAPHDRVPGLELPDLSHLAREVTSQTLSAPNPDPTATSSGAPLIPPGSDVAHSAPDTLGGRALDFAWRNAPEPMVVGHPWAFDVALSTAPATPWVQIWLIPGVDLLSEATQLLLGTWAAGPDGTLRGEATLPAAVPPGRWHLRLVPAAAPR